MRRLIFLVCPLAAMAVTCTVTRPQSQAETGSIPTQNEVVLTKLSNPVYPQLAKQARVAGDVELKLNVRADGTVESADVISGPGMLRQAALDSARQSQFNCRQCSEDVNSYRLVYTFQLVATEFNGNCEVKLDPTATYPKVLQSMNNVTLIDHSIGLCDPGVTITKVRSAKCLYLWKCGHHW
jgi:TonB family protein